MSDISKEIALYEGFVSGFESKIPWQHGDINQIRCEKCGRETLEVGYGDWSIVIRCPDCGHESCICDG